MFRSLLAIHDQVLSFYFMIHPQESCQQMSVTSLEVLSTLLCSVWAEVE